MFKSLRSILRRASLWPEAGARKLGRGIMYAAMVGIIAGLGAIAFQWLTHLVAHFSMDMIAGYQQNGPAGEHHFFSATSTVFRPWLLIIVPTIGAAISGFLVYRLAPEASGHGTDAAIDAYHNKRGVIRARVPLVKMFASAITLSTGGSGGREGPIAQIGAGFGSYLASRLRLSDSERRTLMAAGLGAGIGAIFEAPLAGAIFATEVMYRDPDFEAENLIPAFIATTVAYCVYNLGLESIFALISTEPVKAFEPLFTLSDGQAIHFDNPFLLIPLSVLAIVMTFSSLAYVKCFYGVHDLFEKWRIPVVIKPVIGGLLTGLIAFAIYHVMADYGDVAQLQSLNVLSFGYGILQDIFNAPTGSGLLIGVLLTVAIGKIITTSLTIGSGGSGGVFGPSMVIGGCLGAVVGLLYQKITGVQVRIDVFVILGMASFFAAAANTPVSTLIIVSEMTAGYALLLPSMWVCALAYLLSRGWTLFRDQVPSRIDSPAHRGDFIVDILEGLTVRHAYDAHATTSFTKAPLDMPLREMAKLITDSRQTSFPVVDADERYHGMFGLNDIRQFLYDAGELADLTVAQDLARSCEPLMMDMNLSDAISRFAETKFHELPVVESDKPEVIAGLLRQEDLIATYNARLLQARKDQAEAQDRP